MPVERGLGLESVVSQNNTFSIKAPDPGLWGAAAPQDGPRRAALAERLSTGVDSMSLSLTSRCDDTVGNECHRPPLWPRTAPCLHEPSSLWLL